MKLERNRKRKGGGWGDRRGKEGAGGGEKKKGRKHREKERSTQGSLESQCICLIEKSSSQESIGIIGIKFPTGPHCTVWEIKRDLTTVSLF